MRDNFTLGAHCGQPIRRLDLPLDTSPDLMGLLSSVRYSGTCTSTRRGEPVRLDEVTGRSAGCSHRERQPIDKLAGARHLPLVGETVLQGLVRDLSDSALRFFVPTASGSSSALGGSL